MQHGQITLEREQSARLLSWGIRFFLAAALTASQTPGGYAPFALGCVAAAGPGAEGMSALLGAGVGALLFMDFSDGLAFLATAILIYTSAVSLRDTRMMKRPLFLPLVGTGLFFAVRLIYILQALSPLDQLAPCLTAAALVGVSARFCRPLLLVGQERLEPNSLLFLSVSLLLAVTDLTILEVSVGRALLEGVALYAAYQRGAVAGAGTGLCAGLAAAPRW